MPRRQVSCPLQVSFSKCVVYIVGELNRNIDRYLSLACQALWKCPNKCEMLRSLSCKKLHFKCTNKVMQMCFLPCKCENMAVSCHGAHKPGILEENQFYLQCKLENSCHTWHETATRGFFIIIVRLDNNFWINSTNDICLSKVALNVVGPIEHHGVDGNGNWHKKR